MGKTAVAHQRLSYLFMVCKFFSSIWEMIRILSFQDLIAPLWRLPLSLLSCSLLSSSPQICSSFPQYTIVTKTGWQFLPITVSLYRSPSSSTRLFSSTTFSLWSMLAAFLIWPLLVFSWCSRIDIVSLVFSGSYRRLHPVSCRPKCSGRWSDSWSLLPSQFKSCWNLPRTEIITK